MKTRRELEELLQKYADSPENRLPGRIGARELTERSQAERDLANLDFQEREGSRQARLEKMSAELRGLEKAADMTNSYNERSGAVGEWVRNKLMARGRNPGSTDAAEEYMEAERLSKEEWPRLDEKRRQQKYLEDLERRPKNRLPGGNYSG